jgi:M6 family metalloprotease-like protein
MRLLAAATRLQRWATILTEPLRRVNGRQAATTAVLAVALAVATAEAAPRRPTGEPPRFTSVGLARSIGVIRVVFLLAQFPDRPLARPRSDFTEPVMRTGLVERLADYYFEVSGARLEIEPIVAEHVITTEHPRAHYVRRPAALVREAFLHTLAADGEAAVRDAIERADTVIVFFAGPGKESDLAGDANDPWSNFTTVFPPLRTPGGRRLDVGAVIAAEQREGLSSFGVLCHEFGHLLGLPELYAPGAAAHEGIGIWGLMGQGTWLGRGDRPPHPSAWSKTSLRWARIRLLTHSRRVALPAVETSRRVIQIWARGPEHPHEYFLIENRQRWDADRGLPGSGLLIWRVDERASGFRTRQSDPDRMFLTLMQADGRDDLRRGHRAGGNRGDGTDPWRGLDRGPRLALDAAVLGGVLLVLAGARGWRRRRGGVVLALVAGAALVALGLGVPRSPTFGPHTTPDSGSRNGTPGQFTISDISASGEVMWFTVTFHTAAGEADGSPPMLELGD